MSIKQWFNSRFVSRKLYLQMKQDKELALSRKKTAEKNLALMQSRYDRVANALNDALKTFYGNGQLVTQERLEAWKGALK